MRFILGAIFVFLLSSFAFAETCPKCPANCVPSGMVDDIKVEKLLKKHSCPMGCLPIYAVKSFLDKPKCVLEGEEIKEEKSKAVESATDDNVSLDTVVVESTEGQVIPVEKKKAPVEMAREQAEKDRTFEVQQEDYATHTDHYITVMPTAFGLDKKELVINGHVLGAWEFQYGATDNLQIGLITAIPALVYGFIPNLRYHHENTEHGIAVSVGAFGGFGGFFALSDSMVAVFGGSAEFSLKRNHHLLNVGLTVFGYRLQTSDNWHDVKSAIILPTIGYRYQFHPKWSFQLELMPPIKVDRGEETDRDNFTMCIFYGFRGHGEMLFGEVGFMFPASKWFKEDIWEYVPIGFPYFGIGFYI